MKLGILSDSHDRANAMIAAVAALKSAGADYYVHCGDVGDPPMLDHLAGLPAAFVFGNNDFDRHELQRYAESLDISCLGNYGELELDSKRIGVLHGDDTGRLRRLLDAQQLDYLLLGHSHVKHDERIGRTRLINPGALHRAAEKTVALLDLQTDDLRFLTLDL